MNKTDVVVPLLAFGFLLVLMAGLFWLCCYADNQYEKLCRSHGGVVESVGRGVNCRDHENHLIDLGL